MPKLHFRRWGEVNVAAGESTPSSAGLEGLCSSAKPKVVPAGVHHKGPAHDGLLPPQVDDVILDLKHRIFIILTNMTEHTIMAFTK